MGIGALLLFYAIWKLAQLQGSNGEGGFSWRDWYKERTKDHDPMYLDAFLSEFSQWSGIFVPGGPLYPSGSYSTGTAGGGLGGGGGGGW